MIEPLPLSINEIKPSPVQYITKSKKYKTQSFHFRLTLNVILFDDTLLRVNDFGRISISYFFLFNEYVLLTTVFVLQFFMNIFISLQPRVKGSFKIMLKYFYNIERRY